MVYFHMDIIFPERLLGFWHEFLNGIPNLIKIKWVNISVIVVKTVEEKNFF